MAHAIQLVQPRGAVPDLRPGMRRGAYGSSRSRRLSVVSGAIPQAACRPASAGPFAVPPARAMRRRPAARSTPMVRSRSAIRPGYGAVGAAVVSVALAVLVWNGLQPTMANMADIANTAVRTKTGSTASTASTADAAAFATTLVPVAAAPARAQMGAGAHADDGMTVLVRPGDTVWDLARTAAPAGVALEDYIATVVLANDVDARRLVPGTTLQLP